MPERQDFGLPNAGDGSLVPEDFIPDEVVSANSNVVAQTDVADPGRRGAVTRSNGLEQLQAQFPFLPISPIPNSVNSYFGIDGNGASGKLTVPIPSGTKMMRMTAKLPSSNSTVYYSLFGTFLNPRAANHDIVGSGCIAIPIQTDWMFCEGKTSVDLYFTGVNLTFSIEFFVQL